MLCLSSDPKLDKWIFDRGATDTITYDKSDMSNMQRLKESYPNCNWGIISCGRSKNY